MGFFKQHFLKFIQNFIKNYFKRVLNITTRNCIQRLLFHFMKNLSRQDLKNMISQSEGPAPEEIEVQKHQIDKHSLSALTGETGLKGDQ